MQTQQWLEWRYATKQFIDDTPLPDETLTYILEAGNLTATSYGLQPFGLVVVTDKALKEAIMANAYNQVQVGTNSALIVVAARTDVNEAMISEYAARIERVRGLPAGTTDGYKAMMVGHLTSLPEEVRLTWAQRQSYLALGTMMVAAAEKQVDHCPMEGFDPMKVNEILDLGKHNLHATALLALGTRSPEDKTQHYPKVRRDLAELVIRK